MTEQQTSYRQIMKTTSLFGGVQVFNIIISILKSKFIAILIGPTGMGISGLLTSTINLISGLTNFGLSTSAVKDVSESYETKNQVRISTVATVLQRVVWVTGLLGAIITLILSSWLSQITFGNNKYTFAFIWISITLLLNQISSGQIVLLRGMRQLKYMAQSGVIGSFLGLITTVPLYYFFGVKGIVPGIIISSVIALVLTWYYSHKIEIKPIYVSKARTIAEGSGMMKMGFMISLSGLISLGASYIVRLYISNTGGVDQVGLYNAGFAIINTYVGMVFTAMATDYYPRLAATSNDNDGAKQAINQQADIALLILAPIIMVFLVFVNWAVIFLYSNQFTPINDMILWAALGMFFKAGSWSISFIFLAKGARSLFFWTELVTNTILLISNIIGYKYGGLTGLGISFMITYILYFLQEFVIAKIKYQFSFNKEFYKIFCIQFSLAAICFLIVRLVISPFAYLFGLILITFSFYYTFKELDKRLDLRSIINSIKNKNC